MAHEFRLENPLSRALNHLLASEAWARERLVPFAGEAIELRAPLLPALRFAIAADGRLVPGAAAGPSALIVSLRPEAPAAAVRGEEHLMRAIDVQGNAKLASEIMFLARHLRWDAAEDLSRLVGDVAAQRLVGTAKTLATWHVDAARRFAEGIMEYAVEEAELIATREDMADLSDAQAKLRDGLERLEKRIARLER
jgi:ubiquinone biosynthesis protein UbiJ